jgi:hypothetical protein
MNISSASVKLRHQKCIPVWENAGIGKLVDIGSHICGTPFSASNSVFLVDPL